MRSALRGLAAASAAFVLAAGGSSARAQVVSTYSCHLDAPQTVPLSTSTATGRATFSLDVDNNLTYDFQFFNLQGSPVLINIHGPASPGGTGPERYQLVRATSGSDVIGPIFDNNEITWLNAGLLYMEAHTSLYPNGEIRGQIYNTLAVEGRTWSAVKQLFH